MSEDKDSRSREHLANERTFLAWIRTSIALMGFGFVIVKFALFLKQISFILEGRITLAKGYSADVGVIMVALGIILAIFAFCQYRKTGKQIDSNSYMASSALSVFLTLTLLIGGILLIIYLLPNIKG